MSEAAFFLLHSGLEREGPGDRESLDWAMGVAGIGPDAAVLDAGCGPGADVAGLLARLPQGRVVAVDLHAPYVAALRARWADDPRVQVHQADMANPPGGPFDLIWSAGAIYHLGVEAGLRRWRAHLAPGGRVAFSQLCWAVARPSPAARAFWADNYPEMTDRAGVLAQVAAAGYRVLGARFLGRAAWAAYYEPLAARLDVLRAQGDDPALAAEAEEITLWRTDGGDYGYLLILAEPA